MTTTIRTGSLLGVFTLLAFLLFYDSAMFRHPAFLILVPLIPLMLVFVAAPAAKTAWRESAVLVESFTWWQRIWLLLFLSGLVFRFRDAGAIDQSPLDIWAVYRIGLVLAVGVILCARLVSDRTKWLGTLFSGILSILTIYALLSLASTLWSVRPLWTFYKSIEYLVDLAALAAVIVSVRSLREYRSFANLTWTLLGLLVVSAWVGAIIDPSEGLLYGQNMGPLTVRLEGVMPSVDANTIGEICAILALIALNRMFNDPQTKRNRGWYSGLLLASLVTLVFSQTRAAMLAFGVGLIVLLLSRGRYGLTFALSAVCGLGTVIAFTFTNLGRTFSEFLLRGQSTQSVQGLSGRMDVWQASFDAFLVRPWTGYGGFAGSRFVILPGLSSQASASTALSTYVDSLLDLGIWGPLLIVIALAGAVWFLSKTIRSNNLVSSDRLMAVEMLVVLSVITVRSIVTSNIVGHPTFVFLAVIGFIEVMRLQETATRRIQMARAA